MCHNFDFLKKEDKYKDFAGACLEAEQGMKVSYATTAILARRALELAVKWVFTYDEELSAPYQDTLVSLIHDRDFKSIIDADLFPMINYIRKLGNATVHVASDVSREKAMRSLKNLFEFALWIDYSYSEDYEELDFDESLVADSESEKKTKEELKELYDKLGEKDKKLEELIREKAEFRKANTEKRIENTKSRDFNVDGLSEKETRKLYIDLELELAGWIFGKNCVREVPLEGMPSGSGDGKADYVLYGDDGKPLAVVEAKKTSVSPRLGRIQAKLYADCLEKEHGLRPVIFYTNGFDYYIWDDVFYPPRRVAGIYSKADLLSLHYKRKNRKSLDKIEINDDIAGRYYQKAAITAVCENMQKGSRKSLLVMATGTGKTRTAISIVDVLIRNDWVKNILFLADRKALVKQAKVSFKELLPELSLCNLLDSKDSPESRMIFSTYPTMMNAIDGVKNKEGEKLFGIGHFDLIIIDESHRSIYKKYQEIFNYFDASLLGLTATPKSDIDHNTYQVFELEDDVPTFSYEFDSAVRDGFLVPYNTLETKLKFLEEGIHYDDLSDEEKEDFEDTFDDGVKDISSEALNKFLFNESTVDTVIEELMTKGLKVEGGDKLGKTIIFAKNKRHAEFIVDRFDELYPEYKGDFANPIYTGISHVESVMENFEVKEKLPQIAVSVDMLDTGIDIPEILNLVFFKKVRSKTKFWQMIGRGTRLCPDLLGTGMDKEAFRIFDYCDNFEFFRENKNGVELKSSKSLSELLFGIRVNIIKELQHIDYQEDRYIEHRKKLIDEVIAEIKSIDETKVNARLRIKHIHKFNKLDSFTCLSDGDVVEMETYVAPLITPNEDDELAKRFDCLMYSTELSALRKKPNIKNQNKIISTASELATKGSISKVNEQREIIKEVQTSSFWEGADLFANERVRLALRDLVQFLDKTANKIYYTDFQDEILGFRDSEGEYEVNDMCNYRKKVNIYLHEHEDDLAIYKLRNNMELTSSDIRYFEKLLWEDLGTKSDYEREFGEESLLTIVSSLVGLDPRAANALFSDFISDEGLNSEQINFVKLIVDHIIKNGSIDKKILNDYPFTQKGDIIHLFDGKIDVAKRIIGVIDKINARLVI